MKAKKRIFKRNGRELRSWILEEAKYENHLDWVKDELEDSVPQELKDVYQLDRESHYR